MAEEAAPAWLRPGVYVRIQGLKSATQHNGKRGKCTGQKGDRYSVELAGEGGEGLLVRANNLLPADPPPTASSTSIESGSDPDVVERLGLDPTKLPEGNDRAEGDRLPKFDPIKPLVPQIIQLRKQTLEYARRGQLSASDMADYHSFLMTSEEHLEAEKVKIQQQWRLEQAKAQRGRNKDAAEEKLAKLRQAEQRFNQEVHMHGKEKDWLRALPAYQQACHLVRESGEWKFDATGRPFKPKDIEAETEELFGLSFDEVLQNEESFGPIHVERPAACSPSKGGSKR